MSRAWLFTLAALTGGCEEGEQRPQWLVQIGTDANVPAFGDRVRVDVLDADGDICAECQRTFDAAELPLSFGVQPGTNGPLRVRVTLYRAGVVDVAGQPEAPVIELLAGLPELGSSQVSLLAPLKMACLGPRSDTSTGESCDPATGTRRTDLVLEEGNVAELPASGSFDGEPAPCSGEEPDMICVPGATYLMGSASYVPLGIDFDPAPEQLVRVSSVWLDRDEMTVASMRALVTEKGIDSPAERDEEHPYCTFTSTAGDGDGLPVNCVPRRLAEKACEALGKRLPSEAEWELAASGAGLDAQYPWQLVDFSNAGVCAQAVLARGATANAQERQGSRACIYVDSGLPEGPQPVAETRDEGWFGLRNMGGNVAEWVADDHSAFVKDECWGPSTALRENPKCEAGSLDGVTKGGDYLFFTYNSHSFYRRPIAKTAKFEFVGFRCAKDGQ